VTWGLGVYYDPTGGGGYGGTCPDTAATPPLQLATGWMGNRNAKTWDGADLSCYFTGPLGIHNGGSNFLMCDGHAKWLPGAQVSSGKNFYGGPGYNQNGEYAAGVGMQIPASPSYTPTATFSTF
jgi:prepilin-type processing-associated H-X9-DG protein